VKIIFVASILLTVFIYVFVDHHLGVPERVRLQGNELLGSRSSVAERIKPVGQLDVAAAVETKPAPPQPVAAVSPPAAPVDGQKVYERACVACHGTGIAGAPKFGDAGAWAKHIAKGTNVLYASAINGIQGSSGLMPPKGGNAALSDAEVKAAVDYIVAKSK
jgi:cytochrome c5